MCARQFSELAGGLEFDALDLLHFGPNVGDGVFQICFHGCLRAVIENASVHHKRDQNLCDSQGRSLQAKHLMRAAGEVTISLATASTATRQVLSKLSQTRKMSPWPTGSARMSLERFVSCRRSSTAKRKVPRQFAVNCDLRSHCP